MKAIPYIVIFLLLGNSLSGQPDADNLETIVKKDLSKDSKPFFHPRHPSQKMVDLKNIIRTKTDSSKIIQDSLMSIALDSNQLPMDRFVAVELISQIGSIKSFQFLIDHLDLKIPFRRSIEPFLESPCFDSALGKLSLKKDKDLLLQLIFDSLNKERSIRDLRYSYYIFHEALGKDVALKKLKTKLSDSKSKIEKRNIETLIIFFEAKA